MQGLSLGLIRFIGIIEIIGAIGLILPEATNVTPKLTPISAIGFAVMMILAAGIHYKKKEPKNVMNNIVLPTLCIAIAWYRFYFVA